jgi:D-alanine-D-alanine ligase
MKRLRIVVLLREEFVLPDSIDNSGKTENRSCNPELDVVPQLNSMGHDVVAIGVSDDLGKIRRAMQDHKPHIAFNLLGDSDGYGIYNHHVISYMELNRQPYTGCNPRGLLLADDKSLAKKILTFHRIPTPKLQLSPVGRTLRRPNKLHYPLIVKTIPDDIEADVTKSSIAYDEGQLLDQVKDFKTEAAADVLLEEFIEGRQLHVGVLGNNRLTVFPIWETKMPRSALSGLAPKRPKTNGQKPKSREAETIAATGIDETMVKKINTICKRVYRALSLSGYARMDLRLTDEGRVYVIEAEPNPNISQHSGFVVAAEKTGISYEQLLSRIISLGIKYQAEWRQES